MSKSNPSAEEILSKVEAAIAAIPYPFCIFDDGERALLASDTFGKAFEGLSMNKTLPLYGQSISFEEVTRARLAQSMPADQVEARLGAELRRLREDGNSTKDMILNGKWVRRIKADSPEGHTTTLAVPIEELVQRTQALVEAKREMEHQALHDPLTELPNRRALSTYLERVLDSDIMSDDVVVFHVDLDKFKLVNDTLGHDAGDCVLLEASKILCSEVRSTDFVARVGGDEFIMVFTSLNNRDAIACVAQRIVEKMREPIYYDDQCCQIGASIGIAIREEFTTAERIVMDADIALYEAKLGGRGRYSFFHSAQRVKHSTFKKRIFEVREAIMLNAFEPFFQPQICAKTGAIVGFEALARWRDREIGIRPPVEFLEALEEANLMPELDEMIIKKTLRRVAEWDEDGIDVPKVSVNLSSAFLTRLDLTDHLKWLCDDAGVSPDRLGLEILENVVVDDQNGTIVQNVKRLKAAGFGIALDDFGTGNASISSLRHLSPKSIKIAREFVEDIHKDEELRTITTALISLVQNLGMEVLCEGVERPEERATLEALGCDRFQGFLFAKPMDSDDVPMWIADYEEERQPILKRA